MPNSLTPSPTPLAGAPAPSPSSRPHTPLPPTLKEFCDHQGEALAQQFFHALAAAANTNSGSSSASTLKDLQDAFFDSFKRSVEQLAERNDVAVDSPRVWDKMAQLGRERTPDSM